MGLVPIVDFNRSWTDEKIYDLLDLTQAERNAIDNLLPDYYDRKKSNAKSDLGADDSRMKEDDGSEAI